MSFCSGLSPGQWSAAFQRKTVDRRIPISGVLELTSRCNLDCRHCYLGPRENRQTRRLEEMSTERVFEIIDQICEAGCLYLLITGGDPMIRKDFPDIYRYAKKNGLILTIFCDGLLIDDRIVELFQESPPFRVDISIYGATAETYETITRVPGSFRSFLEGVTRLSEAGIPFSMKTVLMTLNKHEVGAMRDLADQLGAQGFRMDSAILPCFPGGSRDPLMLRVDPEEAVEVEMADPRALAQWIDYCDRQGVFPADKRLYQCGAGVTEFFIDPFGNASPCLLTTNYSYPITESRNFQALWNWELRQITRLEAHQENLCNSCEMRTACTGCPAFNLQEEGSEERAPEYLCKTTRHRWNAIQREKQRTRADQLPLRQKRTG